MPRLSALLCDVDGVFRTVPKAYLHECVVDSLAPFVPKAACLDSPWVWTLSGSDAFVNETPDFLEFAALAANDSDKKRAQLFAHAHDFEYLRNYLDERRKSSGFNDLDNAVRLFHERRHGPIGQKMMAAIDGSLHSLKSILDAGVSFALVSNSPGHSIQEWFSAHDFPTLLIVGQEDVARQKPDPQGIVKACRLLGVAPSKQVAYCGDLPNDIAAAKAAGVLALGIAYGDRRARLEAAKPDYMFTNFQACVRWVLTQSLMP